MPLIKEILSKMFQLKPIILFNLLNIITAYFVKSILLE